jgi:hypothetical protein
VTLRQPVGLVSFVCLSVLPVCLSFCEGSGACSVVAVAQFDRIVAWYGTTNLKLTVKCEGYFRQYVDPGGCVFEFKVRLTTRE